jgi:hypothetical protein
MGALMLSRLDGTHERSIAPVELCHNEVLLLLRPVVLVIPAAGGFRFAYSRGEGVSNWLVYKGP